MKYKGFEILPVYGMCADWKLNKNDVVVPKRRKKEDICWYLIMDNDREWIKGDSYDDCKRIINEFLYKIGLDRNTKD